MNIPPPPPQYRAPPPPPKDARTQYVEFTGFDSVSWDRLSNIEKQIWYDKEAQDKARYERELQVAGKLYSRQEAMPVEEPYPTLLNHPMMIPMSPHRVPILPSIQSVRAGLPQSGIVAPPISIESIRGAARDWASECLRAKIPGESLRSFMNRFGEDVPKEQRPFFDEAVVDGWNETLGDRPIQIIKKPKDAYTIYVRERRKQLSNDNPNIPLVYIATTIFNEWKFMDYNTRRKYDAMAMADKERYERERDQIEAAFSSY